MNLRALANAIEIPPETVRLTPYEASVANLYDGKKDDFNLLLGNDTDFVHHHFGLGAFDVDALPRWTQEDITAELHDLENAQVQYLIEALGVIQPHERLFDGGSGRAGTGLIIHQTFGCHYDGVTISAYQCEFSRRLCASKGFDKMNFHLRNMLDTGFAANTFQYALTNETTMYVDDLHALFGEFARILAPGGRYVMATWCRNESHPQSDRYIDPLDHHYLTKMHTRRKYFRALIDTGFIPYHVRDVSADAIPYWELREHSVHKTGIEPLFLDAYRSGALEYYIIGAELGRKTE